MAEERGQVGLRDNFETQASGAGKNEEMMYSGVHRNNYNNNGNVGANGASGANGANGSGG